MDEKYASRLDFRGDLADPLRETVEAFELGDYIAHEPIVIGYEDFNVRLETTHGSFFVKLFMKERTQRECERYTRVIQAVIQAGINHPQLLEADGHALYEPEGTKLRLLVMEWLDGQQLSFTSKPTRTDRTLLVEQAAKINHTNVQLDPEDFIYDSWAINNFVEEYKKWKHVLSDEERNLIEPVVSAYQEIDLKVLPVAFVHGDLIRTNMMKTAKGLYVFDFAVSNIYPRIQELAVLLNDIFFDQTDNQRSKALYAELLEEYQGNMKLSATEIQSLPIFVKAGHAMHIIGGARGEAKGDGGEGENDFWRNMGIAGLRSDASVA